MPTAAVSIMHMRQAPLVGRAGGLSEGPGASEVEEREKEEEDDAEQLLNELQPVFFVDFNHKRELYHYQCQTIYR